MFSEDSHFNGHAGTGYAVTDIVADANKFARHWDGTGGPRRPILHG